MPLYEFKCDSCEHNFTEILKIDDRNIPIDNPCPNCKEEKCITSIIGAPAVVSPFSVDGLKKPKSDFKERMSQIKENVKHTAKIKDY